jgi:hypothetical protein
MGFNKRKMEDDRRQAVGQELGERQLFYRLGQAIGPMVLMMRVTVFRQQALSEPIRWPNLPIGSLPEMRLDRRERCIFRRRN